MNPIPQHPLVLFSLLVGLALSSPPRITTSPDLIESTADIIQLEEICVIGSGIHGEDDLLATPVSIALVGDSLLVLDSKLGGDARLGVFGLDGRLKGDIGGIGEGPGEYRQPWALATNTYIGKIYVREAAGGQIHVYSNSGVFERTIRLPIGGLLADRSQLIQVCESGFIFILRYEFKPIDGSDQGFVRQPVYYKIRQDGSIADTMRVPTPAEDPFQLIARSQSSGGLRIGRVPFAPTYHWAISYRGSLVHGYSSEYLIQVESDAGNSTVIQRDLLPIAVERAERTWHKKFELLGLQVGQDDWDWNGPPVPRTKPFFQALYPSTDGQIWVLREGDGHAIPGCASEAETIREMVDNPCWQSSWFFEVFDETTGGFLGNVDVPEGFREFPRPHITSDTFTCAVDDESGAQFVKVFRIRYPEIP
ncbi:6-bladed beta-propeller [Gemmatimonadota bacterium]